MEPWTTTQNATHRAITAFSPLMEDELHEKCICDGS